MWDPSFIYCVTGRSGPHPEAPSSTDWSYSPGAVPGQREFIMVGAGGGNYRQSKRGESEAVCSSNSHSHFECVRVIEIPKPSLAVMPMYAKVFDKEGPHNHPQSIMHITSFPEFSHACIHNRDASKTTRPLFEIFFIIKPLKIIKITF